jgi:hypothetical protein
MIMNKVILSCLIGMSIIISGCNKVDYSTVTINVTYSGSETVTESHALNIDLFTSSTGLINADYDIAYYNGCLLYSAAGVVEFSVEPSTYYIIAYLDLDGDWRISAGDKYIIYNNILKAGSPTALMADSDTSINMTIVDANTW